MNRLVPANHASHIASLVFAIVIALSILIFSSALVQAAAFGCRVDPLVVLSNGDVVKITVFIDAEPSEVKSINYTLHVPEGVTVVNVTYMGIAALGIPENLTVKQDGSPDEYKSETVVSISRTVAITATTTLEGESVTVTGRGGKVLSATIDIDNPGE